MEKLGNIPLTPSQQKLVEDNTKLVYQQVHRRGIKSEDLIQEGMLGLIHAARAYSDNNRFGTKFSTYASSCIKMALHGTYSDKKYARNQAETVSYDNPNLNIQPQSSGDDCGFYQFIGNFSQEMASVIQAVCEGYSKKEIKKLLDLSGSKLNSILNQVGRNLYAERYDNQKTR